MSNQKSWILKSDTISNFKFIWGYLDIINFKTTKRLLCLTLNALCRVVSCQNSNLKLHQIAKFLTVFISHVNKPLGQILPTFSIHQP
jgi:hypothetical protein